MKICDESCYETNFNLIKLPKDLKILLELLVILSIMINTTTQNHYRVLSQNI